MLQIPFVNVTNTVYSATQIIFSGVQTSILKNANHILVERRYASKLNGNQKRLHPLAAVPGSYGNNPSKVLTLHQHD